MFEIVVLVLILGAQIYRIVRSEVLLRQERALHRKIEEHLGTLTPAGLWPQYEALKNWYEDVSEELQRARRELKSSEAKVTSSEEKFRLLYDSYETTQQVLKVAFSRLEEIEASGSGSASASPSISPSPSTSPSSSPSPSV